MSSITTALGLFITLVTVAALVLALFGKRRARSTYHRTGHTAASGMIATSGDDGGGDC